VSPACLEAISEELNGRKVDVFVWVDRLDAFRVDAIDKKVCSCNSALEQLCS
jgi:transcription antitermination factor NusA-like protein